MKQVDILGFDAVKESEVGFDLNMKSTDGTDTGIKFKVLGRHADVVQSFTKKWFAKLQREEIMAKKRGKAVETDIEDLKQQNIDSASVRVIGWENVTQPFTHELIKQVLVKNPHWVEAILEASNEDANFTKPA